MMDTKFGMLFVACICGLGVFLSGCRKPTPEETKERAVRKMVKEVLKHLDYPKRGRIGFSTTMYEPGTVVYCGDPLEEEPAVLERAGYLMFIDNPSHTCGDVVFFEPDRLHEPEVLFRKLPLVKILDKDGKDFLTDKWVVW